MVSAMRLRPRRAGGFTLIELLVVLAIVAVLLTLAVPRYYGKVDQAREAVLRENLRTTRDVIGKFYADQGRYPDSLDELVQRRYLAALPMDPIVESDSAWTLVPVPEGYRGRVFDLHSSAQGEGGDGTPYERW
jgi:general secretion pathway protein G